MFKMRFLVIILMVFTAAWLGTLVYAISESIPVQGGLRPGDHFITAHCVFPTEDPNIWRFAKTNHMIELEYRGELTEPLNPYIATAIKYADRPLAVIVKPEDWEDLPIDKERAGVYKFKDTYYVIICGTSQFFVEMRLELETVDPSKIAIAGIPLGVCWITAGAYGYKQDKTSKQNK